MAAEKWPTGPEYFEKTNVGAIIRNLEEGNVTLGLSMTQQHHFLPKNSQAAKKTSLMVKSPSLVLKDDVSKD